MKTLYTTLLILATFLTGTLQAQDIRKLDAFSAVDISGAWEVKLIKGSTHEAKVEGDEEEAKRLVMEVKGNTLEIKRDDTGWRKWGTGKVTIFLTYTSLDELRINGASTVSTDETLNAKSLLLKISGASTVSLKVEVSRLNADISGASTVKMSGTADEHWIEVSGASNYSASDVKARTVDVEASGASSAKVHAEESLEARSYGASSVRYSGNPGKVDADSSGAGSVKKM